MVIFAGKSIYGAAFELQSRVFLKPCRLKKITVRCCSNFGDRSKDFPVRYTPKRSSKSNKLDDSTPSPKDPENYEVRRSTNPDSSSVEISNGGERSRIGLILDEKSPDNDFKSDLRFTNPDSSSVEISNDGERSRIGSFLDEKSPYDDFKSGKLRSKEKRICNSAVRPEVGEHDYKWRFAESNSIEELDEFDAMEGPEEVLDELDTHNENYESKHLIPEPSKTKEAAEKTTVRLLAVRAYTALELKKKLLGKKFSHEVVNAVISDFQNRGFINDLSYAEAFSRSRWSSSSWGPHRIKQALIKKGVNDLDAQKAIKLVFEDGEPSDDQSSRLGLSKPSLDHLFAQASKQWLRAKDLPGEKQKSRLITWLQYRGFNWGVISFILKKLQSGHPP